MITDGPSAAAAPAAPRAGFVARIAPYFINFFASTAVMVLELTAGREVADNVGSSQYTWTGIIGVILAGMSLGNCIGGRLADRVRPSRILWILFLVAAAAMVATLPLNMAIHGLKSRLITTVVENPGGSSHLWGLCVLAMMALVFLLPATALGVIPPVVAKMAIDNHRHSGQAVGNVYTWGAVGMILGTFLTGFVLVGFFTVPTIIIGCASVMALTGAITLIPAIRGPAIETDPSAAPALTPAHNSREPVPETPVESQWWERVRPNLIVFTCSMCLMVVEMVAGRLLARSVGNSLYTWTSVIGVIFAGMSVGNYIGGRLASADKPARMLGQLIALAAFSVALIPWLNVLLGSVHGDELWPPAQYSVEGRPALTSGTIAELGEAGVPTAVVDKLKTLRGREFALDSDFDTALAEVLSTDERASHRAVIHENLEPVGPVFRALREDGVDDKTLRSLSDMAGGPIQPEDKFKEELRTRSITEADSSLETKILAAARRAEWFPFSIRLVIITALVFAGAAVALGLISPVAARMAIDVGRSTGRAVGNVYAWGAWGSILGTFLGGFVLVAALGCYRSVAGAALVLGLLGVAVCTPRLAQCVVLGVLGLLLLPVIHQGREPNALHTNPDEINEKNSTGGPFMLLWDRLPHGLGKALQIRDPELSEHACESDYQYLRARGHDEEEGSKVRIYKLVLDNLIHGYVKMRDPTPYKRDDKSTWKFQYERAEVDHTHLGYQALTNYAVALGRSVKDRFVADPSDPLGQKKMAPRINVLCLGGGSYTFPRNVVEVYPARQVFSAYGQTLRQIVADEYQPKSDSARDDIEDRVARFNRIESAPAAPLPEKTLVRLPTLADVVELDPAVTTINETRLKLKPFRGKPEVDSEGKPKLNEKGEKIPVIEEPRIKTWNYDARNFVESAVESQWTGRYDVIFNDCVNHFSFPYHLATVEFHDNLKQLLTDKGIFLTIAIDSYDSARFISAFTVTLRKSFKYVYVIVDKKESRRYGRETFVTAASQVPIPLDFLGGLGDSVVLGLRNDDMTRVNELMEGDRFGMARIRERLKTTTAAKLADEIEELRRIDGSIVKLDGSTFQSVAIEGIDVDDMLVERGRAPGFALSLREMYLMRPWLKRIPARFHVTDAVLERLAKDELDADVLAKIKPLSGRSFETVEQFCDELAERLTRAEVKTHRPRLIKRCRDWGDHRQDPLVLTDGKAPVDELLAPLFDDR